MRIALVSYEFAGSNVSGGIGTYIRNASEMLASRGHDVEVFTASPIGEAHQFEYLVNAISVIRQEFTQAIVPVFTARQRYRSFDLVEGPDYEAPAWGIARAFPDVPLVVRLHGPTFTINASNLNYVPWRVRARYYLGALRRGNVPNFPWHYDAAGDPESEHARMADEIMANSQATANRVTKVWRLQASRVSTVPLVCNPDPNLLQLEVGTRTDAVLFLGRLEVRKGVLEFAQAIPMILARLPHIRFRFVGRCLPHPEDSVALDVHIRRIVGKHLSSVELTGAVPYSELPRYFGATDVCVFPSDWEASGFVCIEAMAAGRGVIGSESGGMAEIIDDGKTGLLVPPRDPEAIAEAVLSLLLHPQRRERMGHAARAHVISAYAPERIGPLQEAAYQRAIKYAQIRRQKESSTHE